MPDFVIQLIPMLVIQVLLLFGVVPLARRVSPKLTPIWIICSLIPFLGIFTFYVLAVKALVVILDRLEKLTPAATASGSA